MKDAFRYLPVFIIFLSFLCTDCSLLLFDSSEDHIADCSYMEKTIDTEGARALDWCQWIDGAHGISIDGSASDWGYYTSHNISSGNNNVHLYLANDANYLYLCADARSDTTDNSQLTDMFRGFIDGNNDDDTEFWISNSEANLNTRDSWFTLNGDPNQQSNAEDAYNDAGLINKDDQGSIVLWYNQQLWIDDWNYQWSSGFSGDPAHMVYEMRIPFSQWSWNPGNQIGMAFEVTKASGGNPNIIGKYPGGFTLQNIGGWKDIYLGTQNDHPVYSNPDATPSSIYNDDVNETLFTVEATDPDDEIDRVIMDLNQIAGGSEVEMLDDGTNGDAVSGDDVYSYKTTIPTSVSPGLYQLPFWVYDTHNPNQGVTHGDIDLNVNQANRPPTIIQNPVNRIVFQEDSGEGYIEMDQIFSDPDDGDVLTYEIKLDGDWDSQLTSSLCEYRLLYNASLKILPIEDMFGNENLLIKAKDSSGISVDSAHLINVVIQPANDDPVFIEVNGTDIVEGSVDLMAYEDKWSEFNFLVDDVDGDQLEFDMNITESIDFLRKNSDFVFFENNGTLKINPKNYHVGSYVIGLDVEDSNGGFDYLDINLQIDNYNDAPTLEEIPTLRVTQDEEIVIEPEAYDDDIIHGDWLKFSTNFSDEAKGLLNLDNYNFDEDTGEISFVPDKYMVREYYTYIAVEDSKNARSQQNFKIVVVNKNDAPDTPDFIYSGGDTDRNVSFYAKDISDPDGETLWLDWDFGDGSSGQSGYGLTEITHEYPGKGGYTVKLTVIDNEGLSSIVQYDVLVSVEDPDDPVDDIEYSFSGEVKPKTGSFTQPVEISINRVGAQGSVTPIEIRTSSMGAFDQDLRPGKYNVEFSTKGFKNASIAITIVDDDITQDIKLDPLAVVSDDPEETDGSSPFSLNKPFIWIVLALVILALLIVFMLVLINRKKKKDEERSAAPHHLPKKAAPPPQYPPDQSMHQHSVQHSSAPGAYNVPEGKYPAEMREGPAPPPPPPPPPKKKKKKTTPQISSTEEE